VDALSPSRYGMTSSVFRAVDRLREQHVLVPYVDLSRSPSKDRFADQLAEAMYKSFVPTLERTW